MNCHNMYPQFDFASENKFISVKTGIECERCHGPGSIHVAEKLTGIIIDTSKEADRSIVNPRRLSVELQTELCERCHLQGISVLNEGKSFFDFKPGMMLNEVENVFMPRYTGGKETFIMASHADRMKQSKCFIKSKKMSCLTCHNPHISVTVTAQEKFNDDCKSCHDNSGKTCTENVVARQMQSDNCIFCHMPVSGTMDIPHVTVHDHRIQIPISKTETESVKKFVRLECMTTKNPSALLMAQGYLAMYESYTSKTFLLDSAFYFLQKGTDQQSLQTKKTFIHYYFLLNDFENEFSWVKKLNATDTLDAWTNYRIGEAYLRQSQPKIAEEYFAKAVKQKPEELEFINKLGVAQLTNGKLDEAKASFEKIISLQPKLAPALSNLAYCYMLKGDWVYAMKLVNDALSLDPDYVEALMNKAAILISTDKKSEAKKILLQVLVVEPSNEKAKMALKGI
ncbi:MAG: tetratricopeptide repeat protein, partial [Bacteroidota bacterium]